MPMTKKMAWPDVGHDLRVFVGYLARRALAVQVPRVAAALTYTSLLALVPTATIVLAMMAMFPAFAGVREQFNSFAFDNLLPNAGDDLRAAFDSFVANAGELTAVGLLFLIVASIMLLSTVEGTMNTIFRVRQRRALIARLLVYWAFLTVGPLVLASSLSLYSYLIASAQWGNDSALRGFGGFLVSLAPTALIVLGLVFLYLVMPNRRVPPRHALIGGLVAGLLFAALRRGFALYLIYFPTYEAIYGALSAVPILLVWMYLSWLVVLFGAVLAAACSEWRTEGRAERPGEPASQFSLGVCLLALLADKQRRGETGSVRSLARDAGRAVGAVESTLVRLRKAGFVESTAKRRWLLSRHPDDIRIYDLFDVFGLQPREPALAGDAPWQARLRAALGAAAENNRQTLALSLAELVVDPPPGPRVVPREAG